MRVGINPSGGVDEDENPWGTRSKSRMERPSSAVLAARRFFNAWQRPTPNMIRKIQQIYGEPL
jgi:hypothetical protein